MTVILHVVPHTHWDREWYEPFEGYRFRLLRVVDRLLGVLETDPGFRHFNFDAQTAAIEDYLQVRPHAEPRVARAVREGRLAVGPWRILMDEFLCSPETIVRNLQQGAATARRLGRQQRIGYIPDSFGHISQMPQLLRLVGLTDAAAWRGVPRAVDRTVFRWEAPDGSSVRTLYLATSYSNGVGLPTSPDELIDRAARIANGLEPFEPGAALLVMNGTDHRGPEEHLPEVFEKANASQDRFEFRIGSLEEYLSLAGEPQITWRGEMRSGARANLLPGVLSARMPLKRAEFAASSSLERYAEPLQAIAGTDTGTFLDLAWRALVENSAHDSICGCGIDAVADQVHARYVEAARIAELVATDAFSVLSSRIDASALGGEGVVVFNPSPRARAGLVEVTLMGAPRRLSMRAPDGTLLPAQVLETRENVAYDTTMTAPQFRKLVAEVNLRAIGALFINDIRVEPGRIPQVILELGPVEQPGFDIEAARAMVEATIARHPRGRFRVTGVGPPLVRALVQTPAIGGLGWTTLDAVADPAEPPAPARAEGDHLTNGIVDVRVDASGRVTIEGDGARFEGALAFEDGGDAGDEYNYSPPAKDFIVAEPFEPAVVDVIEDGPLRATLRVQIRYRLPASLTGAGSGRARKAVVVPITIDLSLHAGEPFLRATIEVDNTARDHRLRALFPIVAGRSHADGAFDVVERGRVAEGGDHEAGMPTFPCRRWVDVCDGSTGLAVFHRGTPEYELREDALAVTLLRSVGYLSRNGLATRAGAAGPVLETPGAQSIGRHEIEIGLYPHQGDWRAARVHDVAESFTYPLRATAARAHPGELPPVAEPLRLEPPSLQLSALHRDGDAVVARFWNASPDAVDARVLVDAPLPNARATVVGLIGDELTQAATQDGGVRLPMRPWEIVTMRLSRS
ncbi:MAG: alpha-mannosidase [Actinomycetota bacterium]